MGKIHYIPTKIEGIRSDGGGRGKKLKSIQKSRLNFDQDLKERKVMEEKKEGS